MPRIVFWHLAMPCAPTLVATVRYCGIRCVSQQLYRRRDIHASGSVQTIFDNRISPRKAILHKQAHRKGRCETPPLGMFPGLGFAAFRSNSTDGGTSTQVALSKRSLTIENPRVKRFCTNKPIAKGRRETLIMRCFPSRNYPISGFALFRRNPQQIDSKRHPTPC